jgi:regulator of protease activity HflC (stomatin/prohibitin superfamily)
MGEALRLVLEKIKDWWPVRVIDAGCQGIWWRANGTAEKLEPGWHFFLPQAQRIQEVNVQYQNVDCGSQDLTTKDGVSISISLNVGYRIKDAALLYTTYQHFDTTIINDARGHATEVVTQSTWSELLDDPVGVQQEIQDALQEDVGEDIISIETVTLDQLTRPIPISLTRAFGAAY